jgi:hypothetical protein
MLRDFTLLGVTQSCGRSSGRITVQRSGRARDQRTVRARLENLALLPSDRILGRAYVDTMNDFRRANMKERRLNVADAEWGVAFCSRDEAKAMVECKPFKHGMILAKALPESGSFLDQVRVMTGLWPVKGGLQKPLIPDAMGAAIERV